MDTGTRSTRPTDAQIQTILEQSERLALGGSGGAIVRAGLGTLALVVAVFAITEAETVGLTLLCGVFILGLAAHIRAIKRSARKSFDHRWK